MASAKKTHPYVKPKATVFEGHKPHNNIALRIVVVANLGNPLATTWIEGFQSAGCSVAVLESRGASPTVAQLEQWGFSTYPKVLSLKSSDALSETVKSIIGELRGKPDILFAWWGSGMLPTLAKAHDMFPNARTVLCTDTFPDASSLLTEVHELLTFNRRSKQVDGYIHYSEAMKKAVNRAVPLARYRPTLEMIEPFPLSAFAGDNEVDSGMKLIRHDERPHVIFTGRSDLLWSSEGKMAKDALGPLLRELADREVHVYVHNHAELPDHPFMHTYPDVPNRDMLNGAFADFVSEFDAHLIIYNEHNSTIRRRVRNGLSTRLAFAVTAQSPIVISKASEGFMVEYWPQDPGYFAFEGIDDLVGKLQDNRLLAQTRENLIVSQKAFSFEAQQERVMEFMNRLIHG